MQLYALIVEDDSYSFEDARNDTEPDEVTSMLNTVEGKTIISTLQLTGLVKRQQVVILINTGSTHNVLHSKLAKQLYLPKQEKEGI